MKTIIILLTAFCTTLFTNSCSTAKKNEPFIHREWMLISFNGTERQKLTQNQAKVNLSFKSDERLKRGTANIGCSEYYFNYTYNSNGKLKIRNFSQVKNTCTDNSAELQLLKSLRDTRTFTLKGHYLFLSDRKRNHIKFIAADWD